MIVSPLRYPGGKAKLFDFFVEFLKANDLSGAKYFEPYAGGGGLALKLLGSGFVSEISLNDIDPSVAAFWRSITENADLFCELIDTTPVTIDEWHRQKAVWQAGETRDTLRLGFAFYFLNRTNRSGIIEGAGPIGGYAQAGKWKIDVRFPKERQIANIQGIAEFAGRISVSCVDALEFVKKNINTEGSLTYLDPPYFVKGQKLYKNFYDKDDHQKIAEFLATRRNSSWVVSYDDVPEIRDIYSDFAPISYSLNYSAGAKTIGSEVIYLSDALTCPEYAGFRYAA